MSFTGSSDNEQNEMMISSTEFPNVIDLTGYVNIIKEQCAGEGGFGYVYRGTWVKTPSVFRSGPLPDIAVKVMKGTHTLSVIDRQKYIKVRS